MTSLRQQLRRFARDDSGSMSVEAMIFLPALLWVYLATYVFFDAYRAESTNTKAAYTISDFLSRETGLINTAYIDSMYTLQGFLVDRTSNIDLRISLIQYDLPSDSFEVVWSTVRGGPVELTSTIVAGMRESIPDMADNDFGIMVETWVEYIPDYSIGLDSFTFEDIIVARPRMNELCYDVTNSGNLDLTNCAAG
jgi:hypothetical protein